MQCIAPGGVQRHDEWTGIVAARTPASGNPRDSSKQGQCLATGDRR